MVGRSARVAHPTITGRFSLSARSRGVKGATNGSGDQSCTSSSISYSSFSNASLLDGRSDNDLLCKLGISLLLFLQRIFRRKQVSDEEEEKEQFHGGSDRVILIAGSHISDQNGGPWKLVKSSSYLRPEVCER